jgi:serine/threonine protein phosphatase 1
MGRTFVMGDIHGEDYRLKECLKSVDFDYDNDTLIQLGDVVDRGYDVYECVEILMSIKNLIPIRGNHDEEWLIGLKTGQPTGLWGQGGKETLASYLDRKVNPEVHFEFFANQLPYYIDKNNNLFIHAGFNRHYPLVEQTELQYYWDRDLWLAALSFGKMREGGYKFKIKDNFKEIFIGHTPTTYFDSTKPMQAANIWNIDTGSGKGGLLTIMNLETKEFNQF